jgi:WD40 repeat protein
MKRSALIPAVLLAAMLFSGRTTPAPAQTPSDMPYHSLSVVGNWGADLSPDGRTVAVATLRRYPPPGASLAEEFVSIETWDFRANRRLAQRLLAHRPIYTPLTVEWGQVRYTGDGKTLLVYDGELLNVLEASTLEEITRIDLGLPALPRIDSVTDLAAPQGITGLAAMWFSRGRGHGGSVRVYDLRKGNLLRRWNYDRGYPEFGSHVAWSPNGKQLAVTLLPVTPGETFSPRESTLQILDVASGHELRDIPTGYLPGGLSYAGANRVVTTTVEMPWKAPFRVQTMRFWDVNTGKMTGDIEMAPDGIRGSLDVSANARRIVGYIGREYGEVTLTDPDGTIPISEQRFRVWETQNGRVLATSPRIMPNIPKRPHLRLDARGELVLVFWSFHNSPILVYELPPRPAAP